MMRESLPTAHQTLHVNLISDQSYFIHLFLRQLSVTVNKNFSKKTRQHDAAPTNPRIKSSCKMSLTCGNCNCSDLFYLFSRAACIDLLLINAEFSKEQQSSVAASRYLLLQLAETQRIESSTSYILMRNCFINFTIRTVSVRPRVKIKVISKRELGCVLCKKLQGKFYSTSKEANNHLFQ